MSTRRVIIHSLRTIKRHKVRTGFATEVPEIEAWDPQQRLGKASVRHGDATDEARVTGQSERFEQVRGRTAIRGECFDAAAIKDSARVALIGQTVVKKLFRDDDPLGAEIRIGSVPFRVVGVLEAWGTDPHEMDRDNEVIVPITTLMRRVTNVDTIAGAKLLVRDSNRAEPLRAEIRRILRQRHALRRMSRTISRLSHRPRSGAR